MSDNPYSAPEVDDVAAALVPTDTLQISGHKAFGATPIVFPHICVKCGSIEEGGEILDKKLAWCTPWALLLILINLLVLLLVYLVVRKTVRVSYYLCPPCWNRYHTRTIINALLWISFAAMLICAAIFESAEIGLICIPLFVIAVVFGLLFARQPIRVTGYKKPIFQLKGFTDDFVLTYRSHIES